jgi:hypothetical protein
MRVKYNSKTIAVQSPHIEYLVLLSIMKMIEYGRSTTYFDHDPLL